MFSREPEDKTAKPEVWITPTAYSKMLDYVHAVQGEISGFGVVRVIQERILLVEDVFILDQQCSLDHTVISQDAMLDFLGDALARGEDTSLVRLWWHSHANGDTFWSFDDDTTMRRFGNDWLLSIVTNRKGHLLTRLDIFKPIKLTLDHLPLKILPASDNAQRALIAAEVAKKVKPLVLPPANMPVGKGKRFVAPRRFGVLAGLNHAASVEENENA